MMKSLAILMCLVAVAVAEPAPTKVTSADAKALIRALKLAGAKSTKVKSKTTWTAKLLICTTKEVKEPTALEATECQADAQKFTGAAAVVLEAGMNKAGIPAPYNMGKTEIQASSVTCVLDEEGRGDDGPFVCTYTPFTRPK